MPQLTISKLWGPNRMTTILRIFQVIFFNGEVWISFTILLKIYDAITFHQTIMRHKEDKGSVMHNSFKQPFFLKTGRCFNFAPYHFSPKYVMSTTKWYKSIHASLRHIFVDKSRDKTSLKTAISYCITKIHCLQHSCTCQRSHWHWIKRNVTFLSFLCQNTFSPCSLMTQDIKRVVYVTAFLIRHLRNYGECISTIPPHAYAAEIERSIRQ